MTPLGPPRLGYTPLTLPAAPLEYITLEGPLVVRSLERVSNIPSGNVGNKSSFSGAEISAFRIGILQKMLKVLYRFLSPALEK